LKGKRSRVTSEFPSDWTLGFLEVNNNGNLQQKAINVNPVADAT
jgi:hypothetical protein